MTSTIGLVEVIAPDLADSVVTGPPDGFIPPADGDRIGVGGCDEEDRQYKNKLFHRGLSLPQSGDTNLSWQRPLQFVQKMGQPFF